MNKPVKPGLVALFGSGETSPSGQKIFDYLLQQLPENPRVVLLETPAGFELNSTQVIERVADFLRLRLQNYHLQIEIAPARKRDTLFSPDDADIVAPLLSSDLIFAGPGSPTYAVRQLQNSLAWYYLLARFWLGSALVFASAAVIAMGAFVLPVYEIYKVGEDLHWKPGLDLFAPFGLSLTFIPHWNNNDGGLELDTSRCFMGQSRFIKLREMLPAGQTILGIDEHTALVFDSTAEKCKVLGLGKVTIWRNDKESIIPSGETFPFHQLGDYTIPDSLDTLPEDVWQMALRAEARTGIDGDPVPPQAVLDWADQRQSARDRKDWETADELRAKIAACGWQVQDSPEGSVVSKQ